MLPWHGLNGLEVRGGLIFIFLRRGRWRLACVFLFLLWLLPLDASGRRCYSFLLLALQTALFDCELNRTDHNVDGGVSLVTRNPSKIFTRLRGRLIESPLVAEVLVQ